MAALSEMERRKRSQTRLMSKGEFEEEETTIRVGEGFGKWGVIGVVGVFTNWRNSLSPFSGSSSSSLQNTSWPTFLRQVLHRQLPRSSVSDCSPGKWATMAS
ncbi:hypothetical protein TYRP_009775 [Tyrophagus putrescentiae]|nr:hypothetical protein TYRP_009775 [Tyrophagus putrescentiae]